MYKVAFRKTALKDFRKLPTEPYNRIFNAIIKLALNPSSDTLDTKKLTDSYGYRLRIGDYRVTYSINHTAKEIIIQTIAHRKDAYKK